VSNGMGDSLDEPSADKMRAFLFAVDESDEEHGAAWLSTDDDDSLEWNGDGRLVFSSSGRAVRHLKNVSRERTLERWQALARGDRATVERQGWQPGNGYVQSPEMLAKWEASRLQSDREFYDSLGEERADTRCRRSGCARGAVSLSVLCRVHHFESIQGRPSPFDH
jgi:hypothetical protein